MDGKGTYALVLASVEDGAIQVGRLGLLRLRRGFYVYVGSAFGAGGLAARLGRHLRPVRQPHWHIDYLKTRTRPVEIWWSDGPPQEHVWASSIASLPGAAAPLPRFGASDCSCPSHLFFFPRRPHPSSDVGVSWKKSRCQARNGVYSL